MKRDKEFDNILNDCLEQLLVRGRTIEQCLSGYPEQAAELEPLLRTVLMANKALDIQPRAEFKARARYQFHSALQEVMSRRSRPVFGWLPRWATVVTIVLVLILAGGGGTVAAAADTMPDSPLYPVKLAAEQVQLGLTPSAMGKAELQAKLVDRRMAEIIYMANKGDAQWVEAITQRLDKRLVTLARLASTIEADDMPMMLAPAPEATGEFRGGEKVGVGANKRARLREAVAQRAANHPAALRAVLEKVPESAKPALRRAIAVSEAGYERALRALD